MKQKEEAIKQLAELKIQVTKLENIINAPVNIIEQVTSFEKACEVLGINSLTVCVTSDTIDEAAFKRLKVICRALNQGWTPNWEDSNEKKWYPYFDMRAGVSFSGTLYDSWSTLTHAGSRLCFKNSELAEYAGRNFIDLYRDFLK